MTSDERRETRYQRRKAKRDARREAANEGLTFEDVFSFDHLYASYKKCCGGVAWKASTQKYRVNALMNVSNTYAALMAGRYKSKGFHEFDLRERGKVRHIRSVHISERVVQKCLCDYALVPLLSRSFIRDNGACMKYKGMDFALNRLNAHLRRHWEAHGKNGYIMTFDLHAYFDSIPHDHMKAIIRRAISDARISALACEFIDAFGERGLGLGSQISQVCALAYMSGLDHLIKEKLGIRCYGRYMDDGYLIHESKDHLKKSAAAIAEYCAAAGVEMNERKTQIISLRRGFIFLKVKYSLSDEGRVIRRIGRRSVTVMRKKLKVFKRWVDRGKMTRADVELSYRSWQGHAKRHTAYKTMVSMNLLYDDLFVKGG